MADRKITKVRKNSYGVVTSLGSDDWWSPVSRTEAIKDIEHGKHRYFLKLRNSEKPLTVLNGNGHKRLVIDPEKAPIEVVAELPEG